MASVNVGSGAQVEVSADTADTPLGLQLSVCQTNPATGQCLAPPAGLVTLQADANATPTFSIFADANSNIAFDAANNRVRVVFRSNGVIRGETSVAVRTQE